MPPATDPPSALISDETIVGRRIHLRLSRSSQLRDEAIHNQSPAERSAPTDYQCLHAGLWATHVKAGAARERTRRFWPLTSITHKPVRASSLPTHVYPSTHSHLRSPRQLALALVSGRRVDGWYRGRCSWRGTQRGGAAATNSRVSIISMPLGGWELAHPSLRAFTSGWQRCTWTAPGID